MAGRGPNSWATSLMMAAYREHEELVKLLLKHRADISMTDDLGRTAFDYTRSKAIQDLLV
jgi:ankyrin repeat protein